MSIKVSIIVPVYNSEKYLHKCLKSLVNQTLEEIEIILINDCSTDGSLKILNKYKQQYPNKIVIKNLTENRGPGGARNSGIQVAKGEYIGFVDSDDDVSDKMFEKLYIIAKRANYDMVDCTFYNEETNENIIAIHKDALGKLNKEKRKLVILNSGYIWSKIIKRDIIINNNISFREKIAYEDLEFIRLTILYCEKIGATNMVLYNYRCNKSSITKSYNTKVHIYEKMDSIRALVKRFKEINAYEDYKDEITYLIYKLYSNMIETIIALGIGVENVNIRLFKDLHNFFFEVVEHNYKDNKYIIKMDTKDRLFVEINNNDYTKIITECSDLLNI